MNLVKAEHMGSSSSSSKKSFSSDFGVGDDDTAFIREQQETGSSSNNNPTVLLSRFPLKGSSSWFWGKLNGDVDNEIGLHLYQVGVLA